MLNLFLASVVVAPVADAPFPFDSLPTVRSGRVLELTPRSAEIQALQGRRTLVLDGVPLPGQDAVRLELDAIPIHPDHFGVRVDGAPGTLDIGDLTVWRGAVPGEAGSHAVLALSSRGTYGWIHSGGTTTHLSSSPDPAGGWDAPRLRMYGDALLDTDLLADRRCLAQDLPLVSNVQLHPSSEIEVGLSAGCQELLTCPIAVETDYQLFQVWGNLGAMQTYITALLTVISDTYRSDAGVELTFPYLQYYTNSNDPWSSPDDPGNNGTIDLLFEFRNAWSGNIPAGAALGHFLSGSPLGGGVAYLGALCNDEYGFGVSANLSGGVNFPLVQGSGNWDFIVISHELGHNFGSPHTHDYCPTPLDNCAPTDYAGPCQTIENCDPGTIMSYCHLCGGIQNMAVNFHPVVRDVIRTGAESSCLQLAGAADCDCDGIADAFEADCNVNGVPDDCEGSVRGLSATYYNNSNLTSPVVTRVDTTVSFNWGDGSPDPGVGPDTFSARWTGFVLPEVTGIHTFRVIGDDGVRLWIDDVQVIDAWVDQGPTAYDADVSLTAGQPVSLRLEYYENGGGAECRLQWTEPGGARVTLPADHLVASGSPTDCNGNGVPDECDLADGTLGSFSEYGSGFPGSGGFVPTLTYDCAGVGTTMILAVDNALGGASGLIAIGPASVTVPLFGGLLLVGPPYYDLIPVNFAGAGAGNGTTSLALSIPFASPPGSVAYTQVGVFDGGAAQGLALSRGVGLSLPTQ